jgi:hypothetical protein
MRRLVVLDEPAARRNRRSAIRARILMAPIVKHDIGGEPFAHQSVYLLDQAM